MASNSHRKSGSSGRSGPRKRVVIGAEETVRVRYKKNQPQVEAERRSTTRQTARVATRRAGLERPAPSQQGKRLSSAKREERERRQQTIRLRRVGLWAAAAAVAVVVLWGLVALFNAPVFALRTVVVSGARQLSDERVRELAAVPTATVLTRLDTSDVRERLEADPWVVKARVDRDFPSTLRLEIVERAPVAVVDAGGAEVWLVSSDGYWLDRQSKVATGVVAIRDIEGLKPVRGKRATSKELTNAIKVAAGISPELRAMTRSISAPSIEKTALMTTDDVEIYIGEAADLKTKDQIARKILAKQKGKVVYINVRVVESPTWRGLDTAE